MLEVVFRQSEHQFRHEYTQFHIITQFHIFK